MIDAGAGQLHGGPAEGAGKNPVDTQFAVPHGGLGVGVEAGKEYELVGHGSEC